MSNCEVHICKEGFNFSLEEQETVITIDALDKEWNIYTRQATLMTKMKKIGVEPYKKYVSGNRTIEAEYKLLPNQISFRHEKKKKIYTEEEKEKMRKVMLQNRNKTK